MSACGKETVKQMAKNSMQCLIKRTVYAWTVLLLVLILAACGESTLQVAPVGDHAVLEQLAGAYRKVSARYPVQPQAMPPEGRKKFLSQVFRQAGYSYSLTLIATAKSATDRDNKDQRDLSDLLLLPVKGLSDEAQAKIYNVDELAAVKQLHKVFH